MQKGRFFNEIDVDGYPVLLKAEAARDIPESVVIGVHFISGAGAECAQALFVAIDRDGNVNHNGTINTRAEAVKSMIEGEPGEWLEHIRMQVRQAWSENGYPTEFMHEIDAAPGGVH